ncbi:uncharacterized protein LOC105829668 isoform X2 [Monomorium pharaonis]|nr:uncharacterized protein LOC105829668 isoform X2 [Monomorium pharaonis]XP_036141255.1 uncharacterized protein LOC105829668 isoform X2 [Monomorium pharaonis]XP_036141256.1 uncharacterized protein LOC105829668 isoform X2 [Monomorium pharaonis]XP_036141258.1 uncharacterized protein LOC105829668 isoform X2 [Monomorium pharaonis]
MIGNILWPGDNSAAGMLVRTQANAQSNWSTYIVEVKRYYDTYFNARKGLTGIMEYASAYETDTGKEMRKGKRKKKVKQISSSSDESDQCIENQSKKKKSSIPSPPAIHVPEASISLNKISGQKCKKYIIQNSSNVKELKVAKHLGKPSENNREKLLEKIINERKKAMKNTEEKNKAMLLSASSKVLQSSSQKQSKSELGTSFSGHYMKSSCTFKNVKSPEKTLSNNLRELNNNAKTKTKEMVKSFKNSTSSAVSSQTSLCASEDEFTLLLSEKEPLIVSPSKVSNISKQSDDSPRSLQESPLLNMELKKKCKQINPLFQSPVKVDTLVPAQEERSPLSSKENLYPPVRNLLNLSADANESVEKNDIPKNPSILSRPYLRNKRLKQCRLNIKADRVNGWDCWECRNYYNNLLLSKEELQKRKNQCSRHRHKHKRPNTPEDNERFIKFEKNLENISSKLDVVIMNQANLNRSLLPKQAVINRPSNLPSLPLSNMKSLKEFEKFLSQDVNLSAACYYLKSLALGTNEKIATSKLMTKLMTNSLAIHFNFDGHNSQNTTKIKRPFKELKL